MTVIRATKNVRQLWDLRPVKVEAASLAVDCAVGGAFPADRLHRVCPSDDHVIGWLGAGRLGGSIRDLGKRVGGPG